jgi:serine/threonine protein kinase
MAGRPSLARLMELTTRSTRLSGTVSRSDASVDLQGALEAWTPRFRVRHKLGRGGMGIVYRVYDAQLGHDVALKSLQRLDPDDLYFLKNEFRALSDIVHPNLIELYELHASDSACFFTMELVAGGNLVDYVRVRPEGGSSGCDFDRLRDVARQLALALHAVHCAGKLHRDVKPSNIMVTPTGRLVLLDFGLAAAIPRGKHKTAADGMLVGTLAYMAPEQARSEPLTAAADWYSFGVTLYEAVNGHRPRHDGRHPNRTRGSEAQPAISASASQAPPDIDSLISALLNSHPEARPNGVEILSRLRAREARTQAIELVLPAELPSIFQNRTDELTTLMTCLARARAGRTSIVHLHGPSGIGKSELARTFVERALLSGATVLEGRCHPQESIPFNALDGMIDSLSQVLERLPQAEVERALPPDADALPRLFPVLARVAAIARRLPEASAEPGLTTVLRGAKALKALLTGLCRKGPLVLWLDDVQWGDEDSGKLLRDLLQPPNAPSVLLLLSYRTDDRAHSPTLSALESADASEPHADMFDVPIARLRDSDIRALVMHALGPASSTVRERMLERCAQEAAGYPFFAHAIGRYLIEGAHQDLEADADLSLTHVLSQRLAALPAVARQLVEVVAVAGGPLEPQLILRAAGLGDSVRPALRYLESLQFLRSERLGPERRTEIYHHRIREGVLAHLDGETRRALHRSVADAMLTALSPNLPQIVDHYIAAGELDSVRRYAASAARQAADAYAFVRSGDLYRLAIELGSSELSMMELHARLGDVLANAGHGRDAGKAYERAAELGAEAAAPADYLLSLRKRAADQYLKSWQRLDAARTLETVLEPLGIKMPSNRARALLETAFNRFRSSRLRRKLRSAKVAPPQLADRLDVLLTLMKVYSMVDHVYGIAFGSRLLREALQYGDPRFIQYGLACECASWSALRGSFARRQADAHLAQLKELGRTYGDNYVRTVIRSCTGELHHFRGEFVQALPHLEAALSGLRDLRAGLTEDLAVQTTFYLAALGFLGARR